MAEKGLHVGIDATCWSNDRGFGRFTRKLVSALAARDSGIRYSLVFDEPPSAEAAPIPEGVAVLSAAAGRTLAAQSTGTARRSADYLLRLGLLASRARFDVFFFPAVYSYFPLFARTPCVVCYHDTIAERFPDLIFPSRRNYRLWQAKTLMAKRQSRRAMTVSEASAREIETLLKIPRSKIDVITEGPDEAFGVIEDAERIRVVREQLGVPPAAPLLVYVGGFNRHKNLAGLVRAMPQILARHPQTRLAIVGDTSGRGFWDNLQELQTMVRETPGLSQAVLFTGYLDDRTVAALLNSAAALVMPALAEGFGLPAVEAMACGVPVLASARGSLPEVVGGAGLFFDPEAPDEIAAAADQLLSDPSLQKRLALAALQQVKTFTWSRAAELAEASFRRCHAG